MNTVTYEEQRKCDKWHIDNNICDCGNEIIPNDKGVCNDCSKHYRKKWQAKLDRFRHMTKNINDAEVVEE